MVSSFVILTSHDLPTLQINILMKRLLCDQFLQESLTRRSFYQTMSRVEPLGTKKSYFYDKWSLQGPVSTKTLVDCKRPRVNFQVKKWGEKITICIAHFLKPVKLERG